MTAHVTNNTFTGAGGDHLQTATTNTATLNIVFTGNSFSNGFAGSLGGGVTISGGNLGSAEHVNFKISNNGSAASPLVGTVSGWRHQHQRGAGRRHLAGRGVGTCRQRGGLQLLMALGGIGIRVNINGGGGTNVLMDRRAIRSAIRK